MGEAMDERAQKRAAFMAGAGWSDAAMDAIPGDASTRAYWRLTRGTEKAILMDAPAALETAPCPPSASPAERRALGYNAEARLAGASLSAFLGIARALLAEGIAAPEIFAADEEQGFALIEDLGSRRLAEAAAAGEEEEPYRAAIDVLVHLHQADIPADLPGHYIQDYDDVALHRETALLPEWYIPWKTGSALPGDALEAYHAAWAAVLEDLAGPTVLVLRDYHAENLIWRPDRTGLSRMGVIDFQDGLMGQPAYDLVCLLEDARRDVTPSLVMAMKAYYTEKTGLDPARAEQFFRAYDSLGAQRNAKILGIFARLMVRDGKARYGQFMPRVEALFRQNLSRPALAPVQNWVREYTPELLL